MDKITSHTKILFVYNIISGKRNNNLTHHIDTFLRQKQHNEYMIYLLEKPESFKQLNSIISSYQPDVVVAIGGDGTIKLVAGIILGSNCLLGIIPSGSANGLAKELKIPENVQEALHTLFSSRTIAIHMLQINNQYCVHLSDIGFNAQLIKLYEHMNTRGMFNYIKAAGKVFFRHHIFNATLHFNQKSIKSRAIMIVIANGNAYGTGVQINPLGKLDDEKFEVVIVKKISFLEILKMKFNWSKLNKDKTEIIQVNQITIESKKKVHFQIDGEYIGKLNQVVVKLIPQAINIIY